MTRVDKLSACEKFHNLHPACEKFHKHHEHPHERMRDHTVRDRNSVTSQIVATCY